MITAAPLRKVLKTYTETFNHPNEKGNFRVDELECGHVLTRNMKSREAKKRRCWDCAAKRIHG